MCNPFVPCTNNGPIMHRCRKLCTMLNFLLGYIQIDAHSKCTHQVPRNHDWNKFFSYQFGFVRFPCHADVLFFIGRETNAHTYCCNYWCCWFNGIMGNLQYSELIAWQMRQSNVTLSAISLFKHLNHMPMHFGISMHQTPRCLSLMGVCFNRIITFRPNNNKFIRKYEERWFIRPTIINN